MNITHNISSEKIILILSDFLKRTKNLDKSINSESNLIDLSLDSLDMVEILVIFEKEFSLNVEIESLIDKIYAVKTVEDLTLLLNNTYVNTKI